ncbi:hypothetical protein CO083_06390 [Candidatus Roizmanbacteria bacterium CG_4_9_14_0_8_um_filter_34_12]|uniref:DUF2283 domain-containing protein n=3 Tax=Candidatus Roizmaniibacteriota TaxID=1752723 RepID=A0A2H0C2D5_9BACT|nr:MAG: hypothetical protein COW96_04585 [Candidatus Roizmanbacteria bacterium CG22_combo_CG10-13_8_21_14_all_33_16]PIX74048.1 MAG: hypothetical protein COZ39_01180 [Candidatus Roizmanbacteria bacterium CG_4_10_14_3_um_filter_33_21]PJB87555.1 MAG: hypothetical protein CO083_06390 [Candidatus Roizmanbacteria bacterium CG_4_9_14_0_8_um_filter_34_12]
MKKTNKKSIQPKAKTFYDEKEDVLWVVFKKGEEGRYEEITPDLNLEYDDGGNLIGLEVFNASKQQTFSNLIVSDKNEKYYFEDITENLTIGDVRDIKVTSNPYFQTFI